jgi:hypothetical protein
MALGADARTQLARRARGISSLERGHALLRCAHLGRRKARLGCHWLGNLSICEGRRINVTTETGRIVLDLPPHAPAQPPAETPP